MFSSKKCLTRLRKNCERVWEVRMWNGLTIFAEGRGEVFYWVNCIYKVILKRLSDHCLGHKCPLVGFRPDHTLSTLCAGLMAWTVETSSISRCFTLHAVHKFTNMRCSMCSFYFIFQWFCVVLNHWRMPRAGSWSSPWASADWLLVVFHRQALAA